MDEANLKILAAVAAAVLIPSLANALRRKKDNDGSSNPTKRITVSTTMGDMLKTDHAERHHHGQIQPTTLPNPFHHDFDRSWGVQTKCVHTHDPDAASGAVVVPIVLSSTFAQLAPEVNLGYEYARGGNPTREALEKSVAHLEDAKFGLCFSSGLGANTTITHLLKANDHVLVNSDVYGGTHRYFGQMATAFRIDAEFVDFSDVEQVKAKVRPNSTRMFWIETPSNPLLNIVDIQACVDIARKASRSAGDPLADGNVIVVVDNTFLSPILSNPLALGADIVVHSCTKYLGGHCDVVNGAIALNNEALYKKLKWLQNGVGAVPSPFDCYMVLRGIKTLSLRVRECENNARIVADFLSSHDAVKKLVYPGQPSHPQHELCKRQQRGFGGMVSFYLAGPDDDKIATEFFSRLKLFTLAVSLGGVESLANHPFSMTHGAMPLEARLQVGITQNFVRLSVGIEDGKDLVEDLKQALDALVV